MCALVSMTSSFVVGILKLICSSLTVSFSALSTAGFKIEKEKCSIAVEEEEFLGYILNEDCVALEEARIKRL